jgi:hypothetical protein
MKFIGKASVAVDAGPYPWVWSAVELRYIQYRLILMKSPMSVAMPRPGIRIRTVISIFSTVRWLRTVEGSAQDHLAVVTADYCVQGAYAMSKQDIPSHWPISVRGVS